MNTDEQLEQFYQIVKQLTDDASELSSAGRTVVLFRAAMECGAEGMGVAAVLHLASQLMTITLEVMANEDDPDHDLQAALAEYDTRNQTPN